MIGEVVGALEAAMPWLLVCIPLVALLIPGSCRIRVRRAAISFVLVLLFGLGVGVVKIFLSAEYARKRSSLHQPDEEPPRGVDTTPQAPVGYVAEVAIL